MGIPSLAFTKKGYLVPLLLFGTLLATEYAVEFYFQDDRYYQQHGWPKLVGFWIAATLVEGAYRYLQDKGARTLIDPKTGRAVVLEVQGGTFLYVPMKHWPLILLVLGCVLFFVRNSGT